MRLKKSVLCHQFDDKSGILLYDTASDISVLLDCDECEVVESNEDCVTYLRLGNTLSTDLTRKGFLFGT